jgi:hypothetical protein
VARAHVALALLALSACRREAPPPPRPSAPQRPLTPRAGPSGDPGVYRVVDVRDGVTLRARVRWQGPRPPLDALVVPPHGDPGHCGATQPLQPLTIGDDGAVSGAVVWLSDVTRGAAPTLAPVTIDQRRCRYVPRVSSLTVGAELCFTSSDTGVLHNVHAYYGVDGADAWFNAATPAGLTVSRTALRAGVARLLCDAGHTWMLAWVHAFNHPYHAVTDASGRAVIRDVPPGTYRVRMWHEGWTRRDESGNPRPVFTGHVEMELPATLAPASGAEVEFVMGS